MASLSDTKAFATGDEYWDLWINWIFLACILGLLTDVVSILWSAYRSATAHGRRKLVCKRQISLFLALAILSLFVVNAIKFQYQRSKIDSWNAVLRQFEGIDRKFPDAINFDAPLSDAKAFLESRSLWETLNFERIRFCHPEAIFKKHFWGPVKDLAKSFRSIASRDEGITVALQRNTATIYRRFHLWMWTDNIWDGLKLLVTSSQRLWWTQQWFTAYAAWALFVAIECYHREIRASAVISFPITGYVFGLAGAQGLFYILLLLKPKIPRKASWMPKKTHMLVSFGAEVFGVFLLREAMYFWTLDDLGWTFNLIQLCVILLPPLSHIRINLYPRDILRHRGSPRMARRGLFWVYFVMSVNMSGALHVIFTWFKFTLDDYGCFQWRGSKEEQREYGGRRSGTVAALVNSLGDHDWVSAGGVDVLFSAVVLCCWSAIGNLDARSMIKCGVFPWLDDDYTEPKRAVKSAQSVADRGRMDSARRRKRVEVQEEELEEFLEDIGQPPADLRRRSTRSTSRARTRSVSPVSRSLSRRRIRLSPPESEVADDVMEDFQEAAGPAEAAAVAWSLFALGGLGVASLSVFGAGELN